LTQQDVPKYDKEFVVLRLFLVFIGVMAVLFRNLKRREGNI
jgi:cbb3-type cytochrome oxidase subunit 3